MKARNILKFAHTLTECTDSWGLVTVKKGDDAARTLSGCGNGRLFDSLNFDKDGEYFWFHVSDKDKNSYLDRLFANEDPLYSLANFADYELPTRFGWYVLVEVED